MSDSNSSNKKPSTSGDSWIRRTWRPMMAVQYTVVCIFDFIIFPAVWSAVQVVTGQPMTQWVPLTLQSTGFYHMAMGAVLGIAAYTRGQENVEKVKSKYSDTAEEKAQ